MKKFKSLTGDILVLAQENIDTDQIIPATLPDHNELRRAWVNTRLRTGEPIKMARKSRSVS